MISRAEFLAPAPAMFDAWDRNHDGVVTADEAAAHPIGPAAPRPPQGE
jgi:hypothetical protein